MITLRPRCALVLIALLAAAAPLRAGEPLRAARARSAPVIDGVLDDEIWQQAPSVTGFRTIVPDFGREMADETIAYYAYDTGNLYFAFRARETDPVKIKASLAARDTIDPDDWVCINLDSFNDQQALYAFYVNPLGIQMDSRYAAGREDRDFDLVWQSAGRIDGGGYTVEMRIPFKSIRYRGRERVTMGVIFERYVSRRSEHGMWPELDPKAGMNVLIQAYPIEFDGIEPSSLLEVMPEVTVGRQQAARAGALVTTTADQDVGVTARYGLTPQLTADGTWKPDFSQVETDAGQIDVNLRSPLFFPEKRPFFLEGREVFNLGGTWPGSALQAVVHTRTIADPLAGVKVSGQVAAKDTLASIYAADRLPEDAGGKQALAHVAIARYKRSLHQDSYLGGVFAGRERAGGFNRVAGVDGNLRLNRAAVLGFHALASSTRVPGQHSATGGHSVAANFAYSTRKLDLALTSLDVSRDFVADTGYLRRSGLTSLDVTVTPRFYPQSRRVQRVAVTGEVQAGRDAFSGLWESLAMGGVEVMAGGASTLRAECGYSTEVYEGRRFPTPGCMAAASVQVSKRFTAETQLSHGGAIYYAADPFGGRSTRATATLVYQPTRQWSETLSVTYANFDAAAGGARLYDYGIARSRTTFQANRFLVFRGIVEYQLVPPAAADRLPRVVHVHPGYGPPRGLRVLVREDAVGRRARRRRPRVQRDEARPLLQGVLSLAVVTAGI